MRNNSISSTLSERNRSSDLAKTDENIKHKQILNTVVFISSALNFTGSGVIISREKNDYYIITNYHIIETQWPIRMTGPVEISAYHNRGELFKKYKGEIIKRNKYSDLALIKITTNDNLPVALIPTKEMINHIDVFDDIYTVGCQLTFHKGLVTRGIVSEIITNGFMSDANIAPGSSGGGTFKQYGDNYYFIGMPEKIDQIPPNNPNEYDYIYHLSYNIGIDVIIDFIQNSEYKFILND